MRKCSVNIEHYNLGFCDKFSQASIFNRLSAFEMLTAIVTFEVVLNEFQSKVTCAKLANGFKKKIIL